MARKFVGWDDVSPCAYCGPYQQWQSYNQWDYRYYFDNRDQVEICYMFVATSFDTWDFPDPTFNGLFPTMTNTELRNIWQNHFGFDWQQSDCVAWSTSIEY